MFIMELVRTFWKTLVVIFVVIGIAFFLTSVRCCETHSGSHYHYGASPFFFFMPFGYYGGPYYGGGYKSGTGPRGTSTGGSVRPGK